MNVTASRIVGGIEYYQTEHGEDACCARCGSSVEYVRCWDCDDEVYVGHDCGEDCCACLYPQDNVVCSTCGGRRGSLHCVSSPEWCEANPRPGREQVPSTALSAAAWGDMW